MSKGKRVAQRSERAAETAARLRQVLAGYADGVHHLEEPAFILDVDLPVGLAEVYREFDGAEMFHQNLILRRSRDVIREPSGLLIGSVDGDDLLVDPARGCVLRRERDTEELLVDGTSFDRWLAGMIDADDVLYDREGEFRDGVFDEQGELTAACVITRERNILKRDKGAPAPRWRLARALAEVGKKEQARRELEETVAVSPSFSWAWYDLARLSEEAGDLETARQEIELAVDADLEYEHVGFFLAHGARLARMAGQDTERRYLSARALAATPDLVSRHKRAAEESLRGGEAAQGLEHIELVLALAPTDLAALDLARKLRGGDD